MSEHDEKWQKLDENLDLDVRNLFAPGKCCWGVSVIGGDAWEHQTHVHAGSADVAQRGAAGVAPRTTAAMHPLADATRGQRLLEKGITAAASGHVNLRHTCSLQIKATCDLSDLTHNSFDEHAVCRSTNEHHRPLQAVSSDELGCRLAAFYMMMSSQPIRKLGLLQQAACGFFGYANRPPTTCHAQGHQVRPIWPMRLAH